MRKAASLCLSTLMALTLTLEATAVSATNKTSPVAQVEEDQVRPTQDTDDLFTETSARSLFLTAKQYMRHHNYNRAIKLLTRAVKLDPDDPDVRCLYAEALEEKLSHQEEKDPDIFNLCIKNWLVVLRNEVGEEKGATYKGIGIGLGYFQDEERTINAKQRLKVLTGYIPKPWETNDRYLRRVLKPAATSVTATIREPEEKSQSEKADTAH